MSRSDRVRELAPSERAQCEYPSERMLNQGGCTYGSPAERAQWRVEHMKRRRMQGWPSGRRDPSYCARTSKWMIDGECLCALHAGAKAIDIMFTGAEAPTEETTMARKTIAAVLGLKDLFNNGAVLANLRGHAERIAEDIEETSREVGGSPWASSRYRDARAVVSKVTDLDLIAEGKYKHPDTGPQSTTATLEVLKEVEQERKRQRRKGYDEHHDDTHALGEIAAQAALCMTAIDPAAVGQTIQWVPNTLDERAQLIKGIALAVAEVERIDRAAAQELRDMA